MKNAALQTRLSDEVLALIDSRRSLQLATVCENGSPYASYAPFARGDDCLYVLLSDIAVHGLNLARDARASVLLIEDECEAAELFARVRVNYRMRATEITTDDIEWERGVSLLEARHGERSRHLSGLADFRLFRLNPVGGRYIKGFGRAYDLEGDTLAGEVLQHLRDGHRLRSA